MLMCLCHMLGRIKTRALCFSFLSCNEMLHQRFESLDWAVFQSQGYTWFHSSNIISTNWVEKKRRVAVLLLFWKMPGISSSWHLVLWNQPYLHARNSNFIHIGYCNNIAITDFITFRICDTAAFHKGAIPYMNSIICKKLAHTYPCFSLLYSWGGWVCEEMCFLHAQTFRKPVDPLTAAMTMSMRYSCFQTPLGR